MLRLRKPMMRYVNSSKNYLSCYWSICISKPLRRSLESRSEFSSTMPSESVAILPVSMLSFRKRQYLVKKEQTCVWELFDHYSLERHGSQKWLLSGQINLKVGIHPSWPSLQAHADLHWRGLIDFYYTRQVITVYQQQGTALLRVKTTCIIESFRRSLKMRTSPLFRSTDAKSSWIARMPHDPVKAELNIS